MTNALLPDEEAGRVLCMRSQVRLENHGGFIQARLPLEPGGSSFDASAWQRFRAAIELATAPRQ